MDILLGECSERDYNTPKQVRQLLNKKGKFTKSEIMELVLSIGKASVENSLRKLTEEGVIERHRNVKATFYIRKD